MKEGKSDEFKLLYECIISGQVSAAQINEHLKDSDFKRYYLSMINKKEWKL